VHECGDDGREDEDQDQRIRELPQEEAEQRRPWRSSQRVTPVNLQSLGGGSHPRE
jgi:hypothetical protein